MTYLIALVFSLLPPEKCLRLLKYLELSVFLYLKRWSESSVISLELQAFLKEMAMHEYSHASTLAMLLGEKLTASPTYAVNKKEASEWGKIPWDESNADASVDGLSTRHITSKVFFWGKTASSYNLEDRFIYMHILEQGQYEFYKALAKTRLGKLYPAIALIALQELDHSETFLNYLGSVPKKQIIKWQIRKYLAAAFSIIDLFFLAWK